MFTAHKLTVLYLEYDSEIREKFSDLMHNNGLHVLKTDNTVTALDLFRTHQIDIVLIDLDNTADQGLEFIHSLRKKGVHSPAIIITSKKDSDVLIKAINLEITRFLIKPFTKSELLEALKIASKKILNNRFTTFAALHEGFSYDPINKSILTPDDRSIQLSKKEYLLLELLLKNKQRITPYEDIESTLWDHNGMSKDALRTLVRSIRKKTYPQIITNNNGIGYKID